jgi:hypothetical protein
MLQFSDLSDLRRDGTGQSLIFENYVILWDFDILPSPPSQTIQAPDTVNEELDSGAVTNKFTKANWM